MFCNKQFCCINQDESTGNKTIFYSFNNNLWVVTQIKHCTVRDTLSLVQTTTSQTLLFKACVCVCVPARLSCVCICICEARTVLCWFRESTHSDCLQTQSDSHTHPPGPMPTLMMSAPERMSSSTISPVTTLPACEARKHYPQDTILQFVP